MGLPVSKRNDIKWFENTLILIGLGLMLMAVSYLVMVLLGMGWDWGKFSAAVMLFLIGLLGTVLGAE